MEPADELLDIVIVNGEPYSVMLAPGMREQIEAEATKHGIDLDEMMRSIAEAAQRAGEART